MYNYNPAKVTVEETVTVYEYENGEVVRETTKSKITTTEPSYHGGYYQGIQPVVTYGNLDVDYTTGTNS